MTPAEYDECRNYLIDNVGSNKLFLMAVTVLKTIDMACMGFGLPKPTIGVSEDGGCVGFTWESEDKPDYLNLEVFVTGLWCYYRDPVDGVGFYNEASTDFFELPEKWVKALRKFGGVK